MNTLLTLKELEDWVTKIFRKNLKFAKLKEKKMKTKKKFFLQLSKSRDYNIELDSVVDRITFAIVEAISESKKELIAIVPKTHYYFCGMGGLEQHQVAKALRSVAYKIQHEGEKK